MAKVDARQKLEQIRRKNGKVNKPKAGTSSSGNVKDLRQLIANKKKTKGPGTSAATKVRPASQIASRDLKSINKRQASKKNSTLPRDRQVTMSFAGNKNATMVATRSSVNGAPSKREIQYYVAPRLQQPAYIIAPPTATRSGLAMDNTSRSQGASILVSNLVPSITQSDIIELFGEVGELMAVNMINPTIALVTYRRNTDALKAVRNYHNRCLDDRPMYVNMMPNTMSK